jgi:hypothetical protein
VRAPTPGTSSSSVGRGGEIAVQAPQVHVCGADVVMARHLEMRQRELLLRRRDRPWRTLTKLRQLTRYTVRAQRLQKVELAATRRLGAMVGQVDDLALSPALDRRVRPVDEAREPFRQPVIAPRLAVLPVHALLHDHPFAVVGDDEAVQVEIVAVLHRGAVDLGDQPARPGQRRAIEADTVADCQKLLRRQS